MDRVQFLMRDFLKTDLSKAKTLYCYLTPAMLDKLAQKIEQEAVHTLVISHSFAIHRWKPVQIIPKNEKTGAPAVYVYKT